MTTRIPPLRRLRALYLSLTLTAAVVVGPLDARAQTTGPGSLDPDFRADVLGGDVRAVAVLPDGKILLGGSFIDYNRAANSGCLVRVNPDGSHDATFAANLDSSMDGVKGVTVLADGKMMVNGTFIRAEEPRVRELLRLRPDGSLDAAFTPPPLLGIDAFCVQPDGKIVISGHFGQFNGAVQSNVARLESDGSLDQSFKAATSDRVRAMALQPDGRLLLSVNPNYANGVATGLLSRLLTDGRVDPSFRAVADGEVLALLLQTDGTVIVGGRFTQVNGVPRNDLARLNADGSLAAGFEGVADSGRVFVLHRQADGKVLVGGDFDLGNSVPTYGLNRFTVDGRQEAPFHPNIVGEVFALAQQSDGGIIVGGSFTLHPNRDGFPRFAIGVARVRGGDVPTPPPATVSVVGTPARRGFVISRTGNTTDALTVALHPGGSGVQGSDYQPFPARFTLAAGASEAVLPVTLRGGANRNHKVKVFLEPSPFDAYDIGKGQSKVFLSDLP